MLKKTFFNLIISLCLGIITAQANAQTEGPVATPAMQPMNVTSENEAANEAETTQINKDPFEKINRLMFHFNDIVDKSIVKPVALFYNKIVPKPLAKGVTNFFNNLDNVPTVANDVLQLNLYQAASDTWRLALNSTIGILGFFDVAKPMGLEPNVEDFGLTLAQWGYKNSTYIVLPFFGPSTIRDGLGIPVDYYLLSVYPHIENARNRYRLYALGVVDRRAQLLTFENVMEQAALDKYVFMRDAYMQRRKYLIQRNTELGNPYMEKNNKLDTDKL